MRHPNARHKADETDANRTRDKISHTEDNAAQKSHANGEDTQNRMRFWQKPLHTCKPQPHLLSQWLRILLEDEKPRGRG